MAFPWGLVVFLLGIAYGWLASGRQDKALLMRSGLLWGVLVAVIIGLLGLLFDANPLGLTLGTFLGVFLAWAVLALVFVAGVFVGDVLEGARAQRRDTRRRHRET